ncbi:MAG: acetolactate synthase [Aquificota bacterium]|nr:MAG: acetolactate synthase [Aquificota bacterium]
MVKQIFFKLANVPGMLSRISTLMGEEKVNIIAFSVSEIDEKETAIRIVVDNPEKAANVLRSHGYEIEIIPVIAAEAPHHPGGLNAILKPLKEAHINVANMYPCLGTGDRTILIVEVNDPERAEKVLQGNWVDVWGEELYSF